MSMFAEPLRLLCICEEEMCWCDTIVTFGPDEAEAIYRRTGQAPEKACNLCAAGIHVLQSGHGSERPA